MTAKYDNTDGRMRGRALQARRLRVWRRDPRCAMCRRLTEFNARPGFGFQLDHVVALDNGGADTEANTQVLCCGPGSCHERKTAADMGYRVRVPVGDDGWPQDDGRGGRARRFCQDPLETGRAVVFSRA